MFIVSFYLVDLNWNPDPVKIRDGGKFHCNAAKILIQSEFTETLPLHWYLL